MDLEAALSKSWLTIVVLVVVVTGGVDLVIDGELSESYEEYIKAIGPLVGLTAIGRGVAARKDRP